MEKRSFWMYCACEILFSLDLNETAIKGKVLKLQAIKKAEEYGLYVNEPMTAAAWAFTYLTKHFGFVQRLKLGVYTITSKGCNYRLSHTRDDFYKTLRSREVLRSKKWKADNSLRIKKESTPKKESTSQVKQTTEQITVRLNGHELSGDAASVSAIVESIVAR